MSAASLAAVTSPAMSITLARSLGVRTLIETVVSVIACSPPGRRSPTASMVMKSDRRVISKISR